LVYDYVDQIFQNPRALLNQFFPGSFRNPLSLPLDEERIAPPELDLAAMERRIIAAIDGRKPGKPEPQSPFLKRKEAIQLLKTRSVLEACEKTGWLSATTRQARLVLYKRIEVMACVYRISQGEFPSN
jgi:hypothetical protein